MSERSERAGKPKSAAQARPPAARTPSSAATRPARRPARSEPPRSAPRPPPPRPPRLRAAPTARRAPPRGGTGTARARGGDIVGARPDPRPPVSIPGSPGSVSKLPSIAL